MKMKINKSIKAYSIVEILVTLAIFGVLSVFLMQSLFNNLALSAKISARSQIRSELDQTLALIEKDFRNANDITTNNCDDEDVTILGVRYESKCQININGTPYYWVFDQQTNKLYRIHSGSIDFSSSDLIEIEDMSFVVNLEDDNKTATPYANILITLRAQNEGLKVYDQIRQLSVTTRNYIIK